MADRRGAAYGGAWRPPGKVSACCTRRMCWLYVLALCKVGCLGRTRCKRGVALVKFQTFPISYGVTGRIYWPATKLKNYAVDQWKEGVG